MLSGFQSKQCRRGDHAYFTDTPGLVFQVLQMNRHIASVIIGNMMPLCRLAECKGVLSINGPGFAFRRQDHLVNETDPLGVTGTQCQYQSTATITAGVKLEAANRHTGFELHRGVITQVHATLLRFRDHCQAGVHVQPLTAGLCP